MTAITICSDFGAQKNKVIHCSHCFAIYLPWCDGTGCQFCELDIVKQEMSRVNIDTFGISELKWMWMGEFNSDDNYIYYCGQESLRRNGVAITFNIRVWNAVLGCNLKNDRMISVYFQGKWFNITVIQVCAPITDAKEAEVVSFMRSITLSRNNNKKRCPIHQMGFECKSRKSRDTWRE